jgi:hypothetical protein
LGFSLDDSVNDFTSYLLLYNEGKIDDAMMEAVIHALKRETQEVQEV